MKDVTVFIANYKSPDQTHQVIDSIRKQSVESDIFVWNNGDKFFNKEVDWQIDSSRNVVFSIYLHMMSHASTTFFMKIDDDLLMLDKDYIRDGIEVLSKENNINRMLGPFGVILQDDKTYRESVHVNCEDKNVDVCKGLNRFHFTKSVESLPRFLEPEPLEVDILDSALWSNGESGFHRTSSVFKNRLKNLPSPYAWSIRSGHWESREVARQRYFRRK